MSVMSESIVEKKIPFLKWYQNKEYIIFDIYNEILLQEIEIKNQTLTIQNKNYEMTFTFFDEINEENIQLRNDTIKVRAIIQKKDNKHYFWTYLSKNNIYKHQIQVNWDKWVDEEDEDENDNNSEQIDFEQMMASMGGNINMDQMDNMNVMDNEMDEEIQNE